MSKFLSLIAIGLGLCAGAAQAQVRAMAPQQDKAAMCEASAGNRSGGERQSFINSCVAAKSEASFSGFKDCNR